MPLPSMGAERHAGARNRAPIDLPAHAPPVVGRHGRFAAPHPTAGAARSEDAWGRGGGPTLLAAEDRSRRWSWWPSPVSPPADAAACARDTRAEAQQLLRRAQEATGLDDHSGAREAAARPGHPRRS